MCVYLRGMKQFLLREAEVVGFVDLPFPVGDSYIGFFVIQMWSIVWCMSWSTGMLPSDKAGVSTKLFDVFDMVVDVDLC